MKTRKVILSVEVDTDLSTAVLRTLSSMTFGAVRRKKLSAKASRCTIKREKPRWRNHDTRGTIAQVQVNVA